MTNENVEIVRVEDWVEMVPEFAEQLNRNPQEIALEIARRILESETPEDVLSDDEMMGARDLVGRPLELRSFKLNRSSFRDGGPPVYAVIEAVDEHSGELVTFTCGATNLLMQLIRLHQLGAIAGRSVKVKESKPNEQGHTVLRFVNA